MSAAEAGRLIGMAGVKKLLLTHLAESIAKDAVSAARSEYRSPVKHAEAGRIFRP